MRINEKIAKLRAFKNISQEELAELIGVSRQSVSKWEMEGAQPRLDKIMDLCAVLNTTADFLLNDNASFEDIPQKPITSATESNKYFGTDGFRGEVNITLTTDHAYKVGRFIGWYFANPISGCKMTAYRPKIVIGKDTRRSSYTLEYALAAGIAASGGDAHMLHVITTPGVSYVTRIDEFDCGIMITASHNPYYDNGIKVINRFGQKIDDDTAKLIEYYIDGELDKLGVNGPDLPFATRDKIGCITDYIAGRNRYVGYLISLASHSYKKLRIGIDCANGASWTIAKGVFMSLGAQVYAIGDEPDGINVNRGCGSTHIENLVGFVKEKHLDVGFAFDGDADRCIAVDENGSVVDGDKILYVLGMRLKSRGNLDHNTVVATVMSNSGLFKSLEKVGVSCVQTAVGDRFVYESMEENGYRLGGEQSGHIILRKYATTGDGLLTAIMLLEEMCDQKSTLSKLCNGVKLYPQNTKSFRVTDREGVMADDDIMKTRDAITAEINGNGRILLRKSGTEPVIRVMVESETAEKCDEYIARMERAMRKNGYLTEG